MKYIMVGVAVLGVITATQNILNTPPQPVAVASHGVLHAKTIKHTSIAQKPPEPPTCATEIQKYDWNKDVAYAICMAESHSNVTAANMNDHHKTCTGSYSLMQVGCFWYYYYGYSDNDFFNPDINVSIAYRIWQRQGGFNAWSTYKNGLYLQYMK